MVTCVGNNIQLMKGRRELAKKTDFSCGKSTNEFLRNWFSSFLKIEQNGPI
jgi:hypothetical protein